MRWDFSIQEMSALRPICLSILSKNALWLKHFVGHTKKNPTTLSTLRNTNNTAWLSLLNKYSILWLELLHYLSSLSTCLNCGECHISATWLILQNNGNMYQLPGISRIRMNSHHKIYMLKTESLHIRTAYIHNHLSFRGAASF